MGRYIFFAYVLSICHTVYAQGMGEEDARQLLTRTGFAATTEDIRSYALLSREAAVDTLLSTTRTTAITAPPAWVNDPLEHPSGPLSDEQKKQYHAQRMELRAWWLNEMVVTPSPLTEKMTLFWHGHFVSSDDKVRQLPLMFQQNVLLRRDALGNFDTLLHDIAKDPAMLRYLDTAQSRKEQPNENFAREVMELFTLGEGHYSESDIREAARAFTGWSTTAQGQFMWRPRWHDMGNKTLFGQSGNFDGDTVLDLLIQRPEMAELICTKLWLAFISPTPDPQQIRQFAALFRQHHDEIKPLLRAMLVSDAFYAARGTLTKSPVELVVGTLRSFGAQPDTMRPFVNATRSLGQDLFAPPNVKGWPGGETWINSSTLLARKALLRGPLKPTLARDTSSDAAPRPMSLPLRTWLAPFENGNRLDTRALTQTLLPLPPHDPIEYDGNAVRYVQELILDPVYQLM